MNKRFVLSDKEAELIEGIRNYQRSFINCSRDYIFYLQSLFDELLDMP
ncbi:MAG: ArsR family transcriptional regulator [Muribaculaceae bacterium]|nr:ArsR family transcriptional regulator [Muribaculaceae bacterium]